MEKSNVPHAKKILAPSDDIVRIGGDEFWFSMKARPNGYHIVYLRNHCQIR